MISAQNIYMTNCSEGLLGNLSPLAFHDAGCHQPSNKKTEIDNSSVVINGVEIPRQVADQLRQLGMALSWYSAGELEDAVQACQYDSTLIEDHDGDNFRDRLHLTDDEKKRVKGLKNQHIHSLYTCLPATTFAERVRPSGLSCYFDEAPGCDHDCIAVLN